jgi:outer membrane protein insertion porin family
VIQTKEYAFYRFLSNADVYDPDRLSFDRELLRRFYLESGYADFRVLSAVAELTPNREAFVVTFTVEEGQTYDFGTIAFNIALPRITEDELSALVAFRQGDRYNSERVDQSIDAITERLGSLGYAFVDVRPRVERNREEQTINITFEIGEASKVFVERIDIVGNVRTLDRVIRREMNLVEGDAFNVSNMRRSERRIRNLGFFKRVEVSNTEGSAPDRTNIQIAVDEQPTGEISFGIGYSSVDALIGDVGIRERNLLGRGQDLRFGVRGSTSSSEFDISFTEPYFLDRDVAAGFDLFRVDREFRESSYSEARTGGSLRAAYDLSPDLRQSLNYTLKNTEIRNVKPEASRFVREQEGETVVSQIGQTLTYDKRDNRLDPRDGYFLQGTTEVAGLGGDHQFLRLRGRSAYYVPLDNVWGLAFIGQAGYIIGIDQDIPIAERFFIGGNAFRGFEKAGVGPRDVVSGDALGGNAFYVGTVELTFPNVMPDDLGVRTFLFSDIGSLWQVDATGPEVRDMNSVRATIGMGIEFVTAFGRIGVDFAHPLLKESFDQTELFRFSFGTQF